MRYPNVADKLSRPTGVVKFYDNGVVQVVTFAYLNYWWIFCYYPSPFWRDRCRSVSVFVSLRVRRPNCPIYFKYRCWNVQIPGPVCLPCLALHIFLPRDAMHSADYAVARCPSVRLSDCPSVCHNPMFCRSKRLNISSFFSPTDSHTILVFPHQTVQQYSNGNPLPQRRPNTEGVWKIAVFAHISFYLGNDTR